MVATPLSRNLLPRKNLYSVNKKAGKNSKIILGSNNTEKLPVLLAENEEIDLDFAILLEKNWGQLKIPPLMDR